MVEERLYAVAAAEPAGAVVAEPGAAAVADLPDAVAPAELSGAVAVEDLPGAVEDSLDAVGVAERLDFVPEPPLGLSRCDRLQAAG